MSGINKVTILGRLGADPEVKNTPSGKTVASFSVVTSDTWKDKEGNKQEKAEWHRMVAWEPVAQICGKYLKKGDKAYFEGKLQTRSWEDSEGNKRSTTEIVVSKVELLGSARD